MCLGCKTCSAQMSPGDKYSVKISDEQMESFKQTFMMFDKVITKKLLCFDKLNM